MDPTHYRTLNLGGAAVYVGVASVITLANTCKALFSSRPHAKVVANGAENGHYIRLDQHANGHGDSSSNLGKKDASLADPDSVDFREFMSAKVLFFVRLVLCLSQIVNRIVSLVDGKDLVVNGLLLGAWSVSCIWLAQRWICAIGHDSLVLKLFWMHQIVLAAVPLFDDNWKVEPDSVFAEDVELMISAALLLTSIQFGRTRKWPWEYEVASDASIDSTESGGEDDATKPSQFETFNFVMRYSCMWVFPLVNYAHKHKKLEFENLPRSPDEGRQREMCERFVEQWEAEKERKQENARLFMASLKTWKRTIALLTFPLLLCHVVDLLGNYLLQGCLRYIQTGVSSISSIIFFVFAFGMLTFFRALFANLLWITLLRLRLELRYAYIHVIYAKALKLSQFAKIKMSSGRVQSLISTDCSQVLSKIDFIVFNSTALLVKTVPSVIALLYLVKEAFLMAICITIVTGLLEFWLASISRDFQKEITKFADKRLKLTREVLRSMGTVKALGWENRLFSLISETRQKEMGLIKRKLWWSSLDAFIGFSRGAIMALSTFAYFTLRGNRLDLEVAFATTSWLWTLNGMLMRVPRIYRMVIEANVSFQRMREFLLSQEITETEEIGPSEVPQLAVDIENAQCSWYSDYKLVSKAPEMPNERRCCIKEKKDASDLEAALLENEEEGDGNNLSRDEEVAALEARNDIIISRKKETPWYVCTCFGACTSPYSKDEDRYIERKTVLKLPERLSIPSGKLTIVIGPVGSGKSSLLAAFARGEVELTQGSLRAHLINGCAYSPQKPWLKSGTVRSNILFGAAYDEERYHRAIEACELTTDLNAFEKGDLQKIGEKGIKLSGGQQARVAMARCMYRAETASMFVFDDTLSALDAKVGNEVFKKCLSSTTGSLQRATRILSTHDRRWLQYADHIIYLKEGEVMFCGTLTELNSSEEMSSDFIQSMLKAEKKEEEAIAKGEGAKVGLKDSGSEKDSEDDGDDVEEKREGTVSWSVYGRYSKELGLCIALVAIIVILGLVAIDILRKYWLSYWVRFQDNHPVGYFLGIYAGLLWTYVGLDYTLYVAVSFSGYFAAKKLHNELLWNTLRAPMSFFWETHSGRVVNRFSSDLGAVQSHLYFNLLYMLYQLEMVLRPVVAIAISIPTFLFFMVPVFIINVLMGFHYRYAERDIKRMNTIRSSPLYAHFSESISGTSVIRAFKEEKFFLAKSDGLVTKKNRADFYQTVVNFYGMFSLYMLSTIVTVISVYLILDGEYSGTIQPAIAGMLLTFALRVSSSFMWFMREYNDLEMEMVHAERVFQYIDMEKEPTGKKEFEIMKGSVSFENVKFKYKEEGEIVLGRNESGFSLSIKGGERVGLVGRTGSGKSTIIRALLRFRDPCEGKVLIDGIDLTTVDPESLRNAISCVSQEPILFSATIRKNLDPGDQYTDDEVWATLRQVSLDKKISEMSGKLDCELDGESETFSVGEKQLFALARAVLRKSRILLLDEATASVDVVNDDLVQEAIRKSKDTTIITIAHRISTIMDYDRVAVLDNGELVECDSPTKLMEGDTLFSQLAKAH